MKLVVLRSVVVDRAGWTGDRDYLQTFNTRYAERVIGNLRNERGSCSACGPDCTFCRKTRGPGRGDDIVDIIDFPAVLPHLIETPGDYVPKRVPAHDVLLAINIHEQILLEMVKRCGEWGTRGVVAPVEAPGWMCGATRSEAEAICETQGVEIAFPKPFCAFDPPQGSLLAEFRRHFGVGMPDVDLTVKDGKIAEARVNVSAACGATYYIARWLEGKGLDEDLEFDVVSRRMHSYPCTASMEWDDELGETCLHIAGEAHKRILLPIQDVKGEERDLVRSPTGVMVQKPAPMRENIENIEKAKVMILEQLEEREIVTLKQLRTTAGTTPAAMSSAMLILKQQGKIKVEDGNVTIGTKN